MKRLIVLFLILFAGLSVSYAARTKGVKDIKHVVLIGLDGWGAYSVPKADMPMVKSMMNSGAYTLEARSVLPSSSAVNWATMIMGAGPELHGFTTWGSQKPDLPSRVLNQYGLFPTIFSLLREQKPKSELGYIYEWDGMSYLVEKDALSFSKHAEGGNQITTDVAVTYIQNKKPDFLMIAFDQPDGVGHSSGHDTPEYYAKLTELDSCIAKIVEAVKKAGIYESTLFLLTADHGGINKGHGGKTMQEMQIPFIASGAGIKQGHQITASVMQFDTAATLAYIFGVTPPQVWIGRPVTEIFK